MRFDSISDALIGELDPSAVLDRAERWATAALGRPCSIVTEPRADGEGVPLGGDDPTAWLVIGGSSRGKADNDAAFHAADRITRALDAAKRVAALTAAMRKLERSLLPQALLPVPGLQLATRHVPAQGSHDLSGDFYDAVRTGDSVTLIVGDVQGKGVDAATLTSLARHTLRAGALEGQRPAELLQHLNLALLYGQEEQLADNSNDLMRFVTAAVARLDPSDDDPNVFDLTVARAGQPPPIIVRGDGRFEHVEPPGMLLGVCEDPDYEEAVNRFASATRSCSTPTASSSSAARPATPFRSNTSACWSATGAGSSTPSDRAADRRHRATRGARTRPRRRGDPRRLREIPLARGEVFEQLISSDDASGP